MAIRVAVAVAQSVSDHSPQAGLELVEVACLRRRRRDRQGLLGLRANHALGALEADHAIAGTDVPPLNNLARLSIEDMPPFRRCLMVDKRQKSLRCRVEIGDES